MIIRVTKKHIKNGKIYQSANCPLALAFKDAGYNVLVSDVIINHNTSTRTAIEHTKRSDAFMKAFDKGRPVKPTTFRFKEFA
jgi:hypothetical protein